MSHRDKGVYSQNQIVNRPILKQLVDQTGIRAGDTVYDIGCGMGVISRVLLDKGARVIGVEKDAELYQKCRAKFITEDRFELYLDDFLIPESLSFPPRGRYKVFSNIPFIHTSGIIEKLLHCDNPPEDCYLVLEKRAAERYTGIGGETLQSLLLKPLFWADIVWHFNARDFFPVPGVDIVLVQFEKRQCWLISAKDYHAYREFITFFRDRTDKTVKKVLAEFFTWNQLKRLSKLVNIDYRGSLAKLSFTQYLAIFQCYMENRPNCHPES
ncbi:MAG: class I SAM-dependent methyltransferase [Dehalococcoidales bacterium]|nr:MAG: class I SAM-dependent methyltransferase [Dehalococcoidales bacterium]